jgi:hypothetical protein
MSAPLSVHAPRFGTQENASQIAGVNIPLRGFQETGQTCTGAAVLAAAD